MPVTCPPSVTECPVHWTAHWNDEINRLREFLSSLSRDARVPAEVRKEVRDVLAGG